MSKTATLTERVSRLEAMLSAPDCACDSREACSACNPSGPPFDSTLLDDLDLTSDLDDLSEELGRRALFGALMALESLTLIASQGLTAEAVAASHELLSFVAILGDSAE